MKLKTKLVLGCCSVLLLLTALGIFSIIQINKINDSYTNLLNIQEKIKSESQELVSNFEYSALYLRSYLFTNHQEYNEKYQSNLKLTQKNIEIINSLVYDDEGRAKVAALEKALQDYINYAHDGIAIMGGGSQTVVDFTLNRRGTIQKIIDVANELAISQDQAMEQQMAINNQMIAKVRSTIMITIIGAFLMGLGIVIILANKITNPIISLEKEVGKIANGDLTGRDVPVTTQDEIGTLTENYNKMRHSLKLMVSGVTDAANNVYRSSETLSSTTQQLSAGSEVVASTMVQIANSASNVASDAQTVSASAEQTAQLAAEGDLGLDKAQQHMQSITAVTQQVTAAVNNLSHSSQEITKIVDMITAIADQTNLLALNATIEAARAGEQGRGFAVVAEEVRKLAENSSGAAHQIYNMINNIRAESEQAVKIMEINAQEVANSQQVIDGVSNYFREIIEKIQTLAEQIKAVTVVAEQISAGVENVASVSEEQSSSTQEMSALTEELNSMATELNQMANNFKIS